MASPRSLKLVVWDLDETLVRGVFAEGDRELVPGADDLLRALHGRGILQALATQNDDEVMREAIGHYDWEPLFQGALADFRPKHQKVLRILEQLDISAEHTVFVDDDPFERASIQAQIDGITSCSVAEIAEITASLDTPETEESRRRPQMYDELERRRVEGEAAADYESFLASCEMKVTIRPFRDDDEGRVRELLERTNRMNLGANLPPDETLEGLGQDDGPRIVVSELSDRFGDSGRTGVVRLTPQADGSARIETLALSCRVRARGLALSMFVALLQHPSADFTRFVAPYTPTGRNRPLRMLLWAAGFEEHDGVLSADRASLDRVDLPSWLTIEQVDRVSAISS